MTLAEQGAYRNLLDEQRLRGGTIPNDERILSRACGDPLEWPNMRDKIMRWFEVSPDGKTISNKTATEVNSASDVISSERSDAGKKGFAAVERGTAGKFTGKRSGNATGKSTGSVSVSVSVSGSVTETDTTNEAAAIRQVFDAWRETTGHGEAVFDEKRQSRIRSRLREGFSVEKLLRALEGWKADDWLQGKHPKNSKRYDTIDTIFRDAGQVERLSAQANPKPPPVQYATETPEEAARRKLKKTGTD